MPPRLSVALLLLAAGPAGARGAPCVGQETALVVRTADHRLWLCERGSPVADHRVALGRGGTGKQHEGDHKTPLGVYPLGAPRPSQEFGLFIPVGYPTEEQRRRGYDGGAIGIHGPKRGFAWLGVLTTLRDWTRGCIAVGSDEAIRGIARWVEQHPGARIHIL